MTAHIHVLALGVVRGHRAPRLGRLPLPDVVAQLLHVHALLVENGTVKLKVDDAVALAPQTVVHQDNALEPRHVRR